MDYCPGLMACPSHRAPTSASEHRRPRGAAGSEQGSTGASFPNHFFIALLAKTELKSIFFFFFPGAATLSRPGEKGRISQKGVTNKRWTQLPEPPHGQLARAVLLPDFRLNRLVSWRREVRSPALFYVVMVNLLVLLFGCQGRTLRLGMAV